MRVAGRLDFQQAKDLASRRAGEIGAEPMLLAWFDRTRGTSLPTSPAAGRTNPPGELRRIPGGDIVISINDLEYVFVFKSL